MTLQEFDKRLLDKRPEVLEECKRLELRYEVIKQVLRYRIKNKMNQNELAKLIGTKQSSISRFENGNIEPSIGFLQKIAGALGKELHISFK